MPAHRVPRVQLICAYTPCSNPFEAMPAEASRGGVRYCSPACRTLARQQPRTEKITLICAYQPCGKPFDVLPHQATIWKYCGQDCYHLARLTQTHDAFAARFWGKVDKTPGHGPRGVCWPWTGTTHANGYGNFRATPYQEGNISAHIVSWFLKTGEWPTEGLFVLHACDWKLCVNNEACLFLGTHTDNMQDMGSKGRQRYQAHPESILRGDQHPSHLHPERMAHGERNAMSKLTDAQWQEALELHATGTWSQERLGQRYGISQASIGRRLRRHKRLSR
jgi:hypothetical protein